MAEQRSLKSPMRVEDNASTERVPTANDPTKDKPEELMIYVESVDENHADDGKDIVEQMDIEYIDER